MLPKVPDILPSFRYPLIRLRVPYDGRVCEALERDGVKVGISMVGDCRTVCELYDDSEGGARLPFVVRLPLDGLNSSTSALVM
jgi:hypothetical protein